MPIVINEVVAEVEPPPRNEYEDAPLEQTSPLAQSEFEVMSALAIIEERRERLTVD